jgi:hypothetical protein
MQSEKCLLKEHLEICNLTGRCSASPALYAGSLPAGRQEGAQYK